MKAATLKDILENAIKDGIIECKEINSLSCPAVGYPLVHGQCRNKLSCNLGDNGSKCTHRLDIIYTDRSYPNILKVRYRIKPGIREGFVDGGDGQLSVVLSKILRK